MGGRRSLPTQILEGAPCEIFPKVIPFHRLGQTLACLNFGAPTLPVQSFAPNSWALNRPRHNAWQVGRTLVGFAQGPPRPPIGGTPNLTVSCSVGRSPNLGRPPFRPMSSILISAKLAVSHGLGLRPNSNWQFLTLPPLTRTECREICQVGSTRSGRPKAQVPRPKDEVPTMPHPPANFPLPH